METIKLRYKKTGQIGDYNIYLGNIPQIVVVELDGEGHGYSSFASLAADYEIVQANELPTPEQLDRMLKTVELTDAVENVRRKYA